MFKHHAREAVPIVNDTLAVLLAAGPIRGRPGSDLRTAVGVVRAYAETLLHSDEIGPYLDRCFDCARQAGLEREDIGNARRVATTFKPLTVGAIVVRDALIELSLATESRMIADMTFVSRGDVEILKQEMNEAFRMHEEEVADDMDSLIYQALIFLHAAVMNFLTATARPLPRLLRYQFQNVMPSLVMSHRLYGIANRADELRYENKVIHPAFMLLTGRALSR